ncbi:MAG: 2Fe-2S iron-sulfur cluster-binding protein [Bacteroidia bacterium]
MNNTIRFTVTLNGSKQVIETYEGEYRNLMVLLRDELYIDGFGECGGTGRCATCVIKITGIKGSAKLKGRNEPNTLAKMGYEEEDIRLSCQIYITEDLDGAEIEVVSC